MSFGSRAIFSIPIARSNSSQDWPTQASIAPPLIVTKEELDLGIASLDRHLAIADALVEG